MSKINWKNNRVWLMVVSALFVISVIAFIWSMSIPSTIESRVVDMAYEHEGDFDYTAYLNPSHLLGPAPPAEEQEEEEIDLTKLSPIHYPGDYVDQFQMLYVYDLTSNRTISSAETSIDITASGKDSAGDSVNLTLASRHNADEYPLEIDFNLPAATEDWGAGDITIRVQGYSTVKADGSTIFTTFGHSTTVNYDGRTYTLDRYIAAEKESNLGTINLLQEGILDYSAAMNSSSPYGAALIAPPPLPGSAEAPSDEKDYYTVKPGGTIYTKLLERIEGEFSYEFASSRSVRNLEQQAELVLILEGTDMWTKTLTLVPAENKEGSFTMPFTIDYAEISALLESIRSEIGVAAEGYKLIVKANVRVKGDTDYGSINETFSPTLTTDITKGIITWAEPVNQTKSGAFESTTVQSNPDTYLGLPVTALKIVLAAFCVLLLALTLLLLWRYIKTRPEREVGHMDKELKKVNKKYGERIVEAPVLGEDVSDRAVVLKSMEDLIKVADELGKPIIHHVSRTPEQPHVYEIDDEGLRYCYILSTRKEEE